MGIMQGLRKKEKGNSRGEAPISAPKPPKTSAGDHNAAYR